MVDGPILGRDVISLWHLILDIESTGHFMSMVHQKGGKWNILIENGKSVFLYLFCMILIWQFGDTICWLISAPHLSEIINGWNLYHFSIKIFHFLPFWWTVKFSLKVDHWRNLCSTPCHCWFRNCEICSWSLAQKFVVTGYLSRKAS